MTGTGGAGATARVVPGPDPAAPDRGEPLRGEPLAPADPLVLLAVPFEPHRCRPSRWRRPFEPLADAVEPVAEPLTPLAEPLTPLAEPLRPVGGVPPDATEPLRPEPLAGALDDGDGPPEAGAPAPTRAPEPWPLPPSPDDRLEPLSDRLRSSSATRSATSARWQSTPLAAVRVSADGSRTSISSWAGAARCSTEVTSSSSLRAAARATARRSRAAFITTSCSRLIRRRVARSPRISSRRPSASPMTWPARWRAVPISDSAAAAASSRTRSPSIRASSRMRAASALLRVCSRAASASAAATMLSASARADDQRALGLVLEGPALALGLLAQGGGLVLGPLGDVGSGRTGRLQDPGRLRAQQLDQLGLVERLLVGGRRRRPGVDLSLGLDQPALQLLHPLAQAAGFELQLDEVFVVLLGIDRAQQTELLGSTDGGRQP